MILPVELVPMFLGKSSEVHALEVLLPGSPQTEMNPSVYGQADFQAIEYKKDNNLYEYCNSFSF